MEETIRLLGDVAKEDGQRKDSARPLNCCAQLDAWLSELVKTERQGVAERQPRVEKDRRDSGAAKQR